MEVIGCSKYVGVFSLFIFLFFLWCTLFANAQPGFLSIDCGGKGNYTDTNTNITWVPDDGYIDKNLGEKAESYYKAYYGLDSYLGSLRVFPKPLSKSCYTLRLAPLMPHLLRLSFFDANSTTSRGFNYSVETKDMLYMEKVVFDYSLVFRSENIFKSADSVLYICLIRTSECDDPFISAIELRPLKKGMYEKATPGTMLHKEDMIRYRQDPFDRLWYPPDSSDTGTKTVKVSDSISGNNTKNFPPSSVMQTAVVSKTSDESNSIYFYLGESTSENALVLLYFAELNSTGKRSFSVGINNVIRAKEIDLVGNFSAIELPFQYDGIAGATVNLQSTSRVSPIINAYEIYSLFKTQPPTFSDDVATLRELGKAFSLNEWISDPCFGLPWEGVICKNISNTIRVFEL